MNDQSYVFVPEEIVTEILVRLHVKPLFRLKLVSKRWNSIISNPEFGKNYLQRVGSSHKSSSLWPLGGILRSVSTLPALYMPSISTCTKNKETEYQILSSSSGLILFCLNPYSFYSDRLITDLCVTNPLTKKSVLLPPLVLIRKAYERAVGFATRSLIYKVVYILRERLSDSDNATIMVFSSDNGNWTAKKQTGCPKLIFHADRAANSCKGILYWFHWNSRSIVTYDPYDNPDRIGQIQLPSESGNILRSSYMNVIQLGHEDVLKYGDIECCIGKDRKLRVWRLADYGKGEWCLEKKCPISPLLSDLFLSYGRSLVAPDPWNGYLFCVLVVKSDRVSAIDLTTAEEVFWDWTPPYVGGSKFVPIALSPSSCPFYGNVGGNSSSIVEFRGISQPVCLTLPGNIEIYLWF